MPEASTPNIMTWDGNRTERCTPGPELWELFSQPGMFLGTSRYSADPAAHGAITGSRASYEPTRAHIAEAIRRGIPVRAAIVEVTPGQDIGDGEQVTTGRYPVVNVGNAWELYSMLGVTLPGIEHHYEETGDGQRTAWLLHPDGSWARATGTADDPPLVHQSGPRRLWDSMDEIRIAGLAPSRKAIIATVPTRPPATQVSNLYPIEFS